MSDSAETAEKTSEKATKRNRGRKAPQLDANHHTTKGKDGKYVSRRESTPDDDLDLARKKLRSMTRKGDAQAAKILHVFAGSEVAALLKDKGRQEHIEPEYKSLPEHIVTLVRKIDAGLAETYRRFMRGDPISDEERLIAEALDKICAKQRRKGTLA